MRLMRLAVLWCNFVHLVEHALGALRLATPEVGFHTLGAHDLAGARDLEAPCSGLICLHFWHDNPPSS